MLVATAAAILLLVSLRRFDADWLWTAVAAIVTVAMVMASRTHGWQPQGYGAAAGFAVVSMMLIGAFFQTELATFLRVIAAIAFVGGCAVAGYRFAILDDRFFALLELAAGSAVTLVYARLIRRRGWFAVSALQGVVLAGLISFSGYQTGKMRQINWPITGGAACFFAGVVITTSKTPQYARARQRRKLDGSQKTSIYLPGL